MDAARGIRRRAFQSGVAINGGTRYACEVKSQDVALFLGSPGTGKAAVATDAGWRDFQFQECLLRESAFVCHNLS